MTTQSNKTEADNDQEAITKLMHDIIQTQAINNTPPGQPLVPKEPPIQAAPTPAGPGVVVNVQCPRAVVFDQLSNRCCQAQSPIWEAVHC